MSKYGGVWQADAASKRGDTLFESETKIQSEQKKRKLDLDHIDNKENEVKLPDSKQNELSTYTNGGKSCHPKMRAKYMFRTGDFENADWGYDWSSSDNESVKGTSNRPNTEQNDIDKNFHMQSCVNRKYLNSLSEISSVTSESTIPAIDEMESPIRVAEHDWNRPTSCPMLDNTFYEEPFPPILEVDESMPTLRNENENIYIKDETEETPTETETTETDQSLETKAKIETEAYRERVYVTEVTLDNLTVIIHESDKMKGFFKYQT